MQWAFLNDMDPTIPKDFWLDPDFVEAPVEARTTLLWMITGCPDRSDLGIIRFPGPFYVLQTGLELAWFEKTLALFAPRVERDGPHVFIKEWLRRFIGLGKNPAADNKFKALGKPFLLTSEKLQISFLKNYPELKPLLSPYQGLAKGSKTPRAEQSRAELSWDGDAGEGAAGGEVPSDDAFLAFCRSYRGNLAKGITAPADGSPIIPDTWSRDWLLYLKDSGKPWPADWQARTIRRFETNWQNKKFGARGEALAKGFKALANNLTAELENVIAELSWQQDPARVLELQKKRAALEATA